MSFTLWEIQQLIRIRENGRRRARELIRKRKVALAEAKDMAKYQKPQEKERECAVCGEPFVATANKQYYCSRQCAQMAGKIKRKKGHQ